MPIDKLLGSNNARSALAGVLSGAAGGALVSAFTNKKSAKTLLKTGGLVALGGVAWHAFQKYRDTQSHASAGQADALLARDERNLTAAQFETPLQEDPGLAFLMLEAMIAAAHADGNLSQDEQAKIWQHALDEGIPSGALAELGDRLKRPIDVQTLAANAVALQTKIEVYAASLMMIDEQCERGRSYLAELASALELPSPLITAIHNDTKQADEAA